MCGPILARKKTGTEKMVLKMSEKRRYSISALRSFSCAPTSSTYIVAVYPACSTHDICE
jgi:hypothetical protein